MNLSVEEVAAVWPLLDEATKLAVYTKVLEARLDQADRKLADAQHQISVLEQAVKMPEGYARTNHSTEHEDEFIDGQLENRQPNEWVGVKVA